MAGDTMRIDILEDGTVKVTTDKVSDVNHLSADELLKLMDQLLGGEVTKEKSPHAHTHAHQHDHKKAW